MIVAKFGGTSVNTKERVLTLCQIVENQLNRQPVVVVSALRGVTDLLLSLPALPKYKVKKALKQLIKVHTNLAQDLWEDRQIKKAFKQYTISKVAEIEKLLRKKKFNKAMMDKLVYYGEIMSSYMIAQAFVQKGIKAEQAVAIDLIVTDNSFGSAEFLVGLTKRNTKKVLVPIIKRGIVPVITGFIGSTVNGQTTTLGRGGSDYSAAILGFCLEAEEIQIWTDVDGIMTTDPRMVSNAKSVEMVSYEEASELARLGAKVLHPKTILPAIEKNIPVKILNTQNPTHKGTTILKEVKKANHITSIACKKGVKLINIHSPKMFRMYGFLHKVFKVFDDLQISVDFISTSEVNVSLTIDGKYDTTQLVKQLKKLADVEIKVGRATVSVVGTPKTGSSVICGSVYTFFESKKIDIEMISVGASKINETVVVKEEKAEEIVKILHKNYFGV